VDAEIAALIGAGVASGVSLASQFVANELSLRRDRRNQRRQRLSDVIVAAALALYSQSGDREATKAAQDARKARPSQTGTVAAPLEPDHPLVSGSIDPLLDRTGDAIGLLQIHFGHDHPLIESYGETCQIVWRARARLAQGSDENESELEELPRLLLEAHRARDAWMVAAQAEVEKI
jgi:hypothetical protein